MGLRVDNWKLSFGVKKEGMWWSDKTYPSVPYVFNLGARRVFCGPGYRSKWMSTGARGIASRRRAKRH